MPNQAFLIDGKYIQIDDRMFNIEEVYYCKEKVQEYHRGTVHGETLPAFITGINVSNLNKVLLVPYRSTYFGIFDPATNNYSRGAAHGRTVSSVSPFSMSSVVAVPNNKILCMPAESVTNTTNLLNRQAALYDMNTNSVTNIDFNVADISASVIMITNGFARKTNGNLLFSLYEVGKGLAYTWVLEYDLVSEKFLQPIQITNQGKYGALYTYLHMDNNVNTPNSGFGGSKHLGNTLNGEQILSIYLPNGSANNPIAIFKYNPVQDIFLTETTTVRVPDFVVAVSSNNLYYSGCLPISQGEFLCTASFASRDENYVGDGNYIYNGTSKGFAVANYPPGLIPPNQFSVASMASYVELSDQYIFANISTSTLDVIDSLIGFHKATKTFSKIYTRTEYTEFDSFFGICQTNDGRLVMAPGSSPYVGIIE